MERVRHIHRIAHIRRIVAQPDIPEVSPRSENSGHRHQRHSHFRSIELDASSPSRPVGLSQAERLVPQQRL